MIHGRVYAIRSHQTKDLYIGSTIQALSMRMAHHRRDYKCYLNGTPNYITSFKIVQYADAFIELLFEGEFESKQALQKKEGEYQRELECVNRMIAGRTDKEYREDHKEQRKEYYQIHKEQLSTYNYQYRHENTDRIKEYRKRRITCECGSVFGINDQSTHARTKKHQEFIRNKI